MGFFNEIFVTMFVATISKMFHCKIVDSFAVKYIPNTKIIDVWDFK